MAKTLLHVVQSISADLTPKLQEWVPGLEVVPVAMDRATWLDAVVALFAKTEQFFALVVPGEWHDTCAVGQNKEFMALLMSGRARVAYWGSRPHRVLAYPVLNVPKDSGQEVQAGLVRCLLRTASPGISQLLLPGSEVYTERVAAIQEQGKKLDQAMAYTLSRTRLPVEAQLKIRLALTACMAFAFEEQAEGARGLPPALQLGVSENLAVASVRWKTRRKDPLEWSEPGMILSTAASCAEAMWLHAIPEAGEVEAVFFFTRHETEGSRLEFERVPLGIDILTNTRLELFQAFPDRLQPEGVTLRAWKDLPEPGETLAKKAQAAKAAVKAEAEARKEAEKTAESSGQVERLQELAGDYKKRLMETSKKLQALIALERETASKLKAAVQELDEVRTASRERELELARKLAACLRDLQQIRKKAG